MGVDVGKIVFLKKSMYGSRDPPSNWERDWREHVKGLGYQLGLSSQNLFRRDEHRVSGMTHVDDFVVTRPTDRPADLWNNLQWCGRSKQKSSVWVDRKHQCVAQKIASRSTPAHWHANIVKKELRVSSKTL